MAKKKETPLPAIPPLDEELIKALEERFPSRCPKLTDSDREIWCYVGQRKVVEFLRDQYERQQENTI